MSETKKPGAYYYISPTLMLGPNADERLVIHNAETDEVMDLGPNTSSTIKFLTHCLSRLMIHTKE